MFVCLLVHPHSPPPITLSVLANSHQIWQEVEVSKTIKFLQIFLWLLNSAGRGGERHELVLTPRGKRQPSSALATSPWQWQAASPTAASSGPRQPWPRCQAARRDVEQGWAVGGCQREDGAETGEHGGTAEMRSTKPALSILWWNGTC